MSEESYEREKRTAQIRDRLAGLVGQEPDVPLFEDLVIDVAKVPGWRFLFVPSAGPRAGEQIERSFIVKDGTYEQCVEQLLLKYGLRSKIIWAKSLHSNEEFTSIEEWT